MPKRSIRNRQRQVFNSLITISVCNHSKGGLLEIQGIAALIVTAKARLRPVQEKQKVGRFSAYYLDTKSNLFTGRLNLAVRSWMVWIWVGS